MTLVALGLAVQSAGQTAVAYSQLHSWLSPLHLGLSAAAAAGAGWLVAPRYPAQLGLVLGATTHGVSAMLWQASALDSRWGGPLLQGWLLFVGASFGLSLRSNIIRPHRRWLYSGQLRKWLPPARQLGVLCVLLLSLAMLQLLGPLMSGIGVAASFMIAAALDADTLNPNPHVPAYAPSRVRKLRMLSTRWLLVPAVGSALSVALATPLLLAPDGRALRSRLLYRTGDHNSQQLTFAKSRSGLELYVDGKLHLGGLDSRRYVHALVEGVTPCGSSVLVLDLGSGELATQVAAPHIKVTAVAQSFRLRRLARRQHWLRGQIAPSTERIRWIEDDPMAWLNEQTARFDCIVADLPPPTTYEFSKYYTRYFYHLLAEHLEPDGHAIVSGLSPSGSHHSYDLLVTTIEAANLSIQSIPAAVPSLGDWVLLRLEHSTERFPITDISTLHEPRVFDAFIKEQDRDLELFER